MVWEFGEDVEKTVLEFAKEEFRNTGCYFYTNDAISGLYSVEARLRNKVVEHRPALFPKEESLDLDNLSLQEYSRFFG